MTLSVALRNMKAGKARLAFSIAGVAVAVLLLSFVLALYRGWSEGLAEYIDDTDADVWLAPLGSQSFFTPGFYSRTFVEQAADTDGVTAAFGILYRPARMTFDGEGFDTWVVGFPTDGPGGPVRMDSGTRTPGDGEVVLDKVVSKLSGAEIGDEVLVGTRKLKVVGLSEGGNAVFAQLIFVSETEAIEEFRIALDEANVPAGQLDPARQVNLALLRTEPGRAEEVVAAINKRVPAVTAYTSSDFSEGSRKALKQAMLPILFIILALAFLVGLLVLSLTVYTSVLEKEREFGVIKALGVPGPGMLRVVFEQALVSCIAGFLLGMLATFLATLVVTTVVPQFITIYRPTDVLIIFAGAVVMSLFASIIPAGRIMRADALSVFKA